MIYLIIALILILFTRTWNYSKLIDDNVPRSGYLRVLTTERIDPNFYMQKRPIMYVITNISVYIATCMYIYLLWGWKVALLYAVMPLNVSAGTWSVGNMYMTTTLFILTAFYFLTHFPIAWVGIIISCVFYFAALHSTVSAIPYVVILAFQILVPLNRTEWYFVAIFLHLGTLLLFLFGKRFREGLRLRKEMHKKKGVSAGTFNLKRIFVMVKVIAYYIMLSLWPSRLGFFHEFGQGEFMKGKLEKPSRLFFISLILLLVFIYFAWPIDPFAVIWFLVFIGIFSQFTTFGMFIAERYTFIANIGICIILSKYIIWPEVYWILATLWFYRSHLYVPAWKHNYTLFSYSITNQPEAPENYVNLASYYLEWKKPHQAIPPLLCALDRVTGDKSKVHTNLAGAYADIREYEKSLYHTQEALKTCDHDKRQSLRLQASDLMARIRKTSQIRRKLGEV